MWLHIPNSHFSQAQAADCSAPRTCLAGEPCAMSNGTSMPLTCSKPESAMDTSTTHPFGTMPSPSTGDRGVDLWISSLRASLASRSALPEKGSPKTTRATASQPSAVSFARYDRDSRSWKMYPDLFQNHISQPFAENFPKRGMTLNGIAYRLPRSARTTRGTGFGYLLPTPTVAMEAPNKNANTHGPKNLLEVARTGWNAGEPWMVPPRANEHGQYQYDRGDHSKPRLTLTGFAKMFPTPRSRDWKGQSQRGQHAPMDALPNYVAQDGNGGKLNPNWVEWLMGFPIGWTDLEPLAMDKFQQWLKKHGRDYRTGVE